jgi:hypothetical protein
MYVCCWEFKLEKEKVMKREDRYTIISSNSIEILERKKDYICREMTMMSDLDKKGKVEIREETDKRWYKFELSIPLEYSQYRVDIEKIRQAAEDFENGYQACLRLWKKEKDEGRAWEVKRILGKFEYLDDFEKALRGFKKTTKVEKELLKEEINSFKKSPKLGETWMFVKFLFEFVERNGFDLKCEEYDKIVCWEKR